MAGFNYLAPIIPSDEWQNAAAAVLLAGGLVCMGYLASRNAKTKEERERLIIPDRKLGLTTFFDFFVELFVKFHDGVLGKDNRKYLPLAGSIFIFIFSANILSLIPGMPVVTNLVWVTVGMALVVFVAFNAYGIKENGLKGYLAHFLGPVAILGPLVMILEMVSMVLRILTLNLRLYWNVKADHIVLDTFTGMVNFLVPVPFYLLGTFVSFMQAFVFTILTMIYILLATQHGEEH